MLGESAVDDGDYARYICASEIMKRERTIYLLYMMYMYRYFEVCIPDGRKCLSIYCQKERDIHVGNLLYECLFLTRSKCKIIFTKMCEL